MRNLIILLIILAFCAIPKKGYAADFSFGIVAGTTMSNMSTDYKVQEPFKPFESNTYVTITGGVVVNIDFWKGLGLRTGVEFQKIGANTYSDCFPFAPLGSQSNSEKDISIWAFNLGIPVCPSYKISIPEINKIVEPIVFTGPVISIMLQHAYTQWISKNSINVDWRAGLALLFLKRYEISASYNRNLTEMLYFSTNKSDHYKFDIGYWNLQLGFYF